MEVYMCIFFIPINKKEAITISKGKETLTISINKKEALTISIGKVS